MEGIPRKEAEPNSREEVVQALREKDPSAMEKLNAWLDIQDLRVEREEITNLERNIAWAELYRDAGLYSEAREVFADCIEQAYQEDNDEKLAYCESELEKLANLN